MRSVYPGDNNIGVRLKTWKKHKFWPEDATEEIEKTWGIPHGNSGDTILILRDRSLSVFRYPLDGTSICPRLTPAW